MYEEKNIYYKNIKYIKNKMFVHNKILNKCCVHLPNSKFAGKRKFNIKQINFPMAETTSGQNIYLIWCQHVYPRQKG